VIKNQLSYYNSDKLILSLCDFSGAWSKPYFDAGYDVRRVDILTGQDVRLLTIPEKPIYGVLAAPPCTDFSASGACWWKKKGEKALVESLSIVDACLRFSILADAFWVLENPVGRLGRYLGKPVWRFNPCDYGDPYTKKTCLWGKFNIPEFNKVPAPKVTEGHHSIDHFLKNKGEKLGRNRSMLRSITPAGFAEAFFKANK